MPKRERRCDNMDGLVGVTKALGPGMFFKGGGSSECGRGRQT